MLWRKLQISGELLLHQLLLLYHSHLCLEPPAHNSWPRRHTKCSLWLSRIYLASGILAAMPGQYSGVILHVGGHSARRHNFTAHNTRE